MADTLCDAPTNPVRLPNGIKLKKLFSNIAARFDCLAFTAFSHPRHELQLDGLEIFLLLQVQPNCWHSLRKSAVLAPATCKFMKIEYGNLRAISASSLPRRFC